MESYEREQECTLYTNFLTLENKEPASVVDQKITIRHVNDSDVLITDVNEVALILATETLYYYKWNVPSDAYLGEYTVEYSAIIDGEYAEGNESIKVIASGTSAPAITGNLYTTKAKVAAYLGVEASTISEDWIDMASRYIDLYTNRIFYTKTVTDEKYDIEKQGQNELFVDQFPLTEVTEVKNDGDVMDTADYLVYLEEGIIKLADDFQGNIYNVGAFIYGRQKVSVSYSYGNVTIPREIEWVAMVITSNIAFTSLVNSGELKFGNVTEEQIGEYRYKEGSQSSIQDKVDEAQKVSDRLEEDVLSVKNVLRVYRTRKMRAV